MPLQDLTPQLRTRLSRMERAAGWFVLLATLLLLGGFAYYVYHTAERKGWFLTKAPYFTLIERGTGLKVGDPVKLMGFDAGRITAIKPMPPENFEHNVYVEFEIKEPHYGYLWTEGSFAKVAAEDFLGSRMLEVTKGTGGYPTYMFHPWREFTLREAMEARDMEKWRLAGEYWDAAGTNRLLKALAPLTKTNLTVLAALGVEKFGALDTRETRQHPTAVWNDGIRSKNEAAFVPYGRTNLYWLIASESPAVTEQIDKVVAQVVKGLPGFFALTNQIAATLSNAIALTSNLTEVSTDVRPVLSNVTALTGQLRGPGALGDWLLPTNASAELQLALTNANAALVRADALLASTDTNLTAVAEELEVAIRHLADITSNLNSQVQANTNILSEISQAIVHTDELMQGLKRHWLLRPAFKTKPPPKTNAPPAKAR